MTDAALLGYYESIAVAFGPAGLSAKVCLASVLALVARGNRRPGHGLLVGALVASFAVCFWLAISDQSTYASAGRRAIVPAVACFMMTAALVVQFFQPEGTWSLATSVRWKRVVAGALLAWAFWYPPLDPRFIRSILFSPVGVVPQPSMIILGVAAWLSMPNAPRLIAWATALVSIALAVADVSMAGMWSSLVMVVPAGLLIFELTRSVRTSGGVLEDDRPRVDKVAREKAVTSEGTKPDRVWKLK